MKIKNLKIKGLKIVKSNIYRDKRGLFREISKQNILNEKWVFDCMSHSKKGVLRGLHIQTKKPQAKLITVSHGKIFDVVVDLRPNSKTFGKYYSIIMSHNSDFSFFIPEGFAHGFLCLSPKCIINYKCSQYRDVKSENTLSWNDSSVNIKWPIKKPLLSAKDKIGKNLNFFK